MMIFVCFLPAATMSVCIRQGELHLFSHQRLIYTCTLTHLGLLATLYCFWMNGKTHLSVKENSFNALGCNHVFIKLPNDLFQQSCQKDKSYDGNNQH